MQVKCTRGELYKRLSAISMEKAAQISSHSSFMGVLNQTADAANPEFEVLLAYLKQARDCDLTSYKRSTLQRRFQHRMQKLKIDTYQKYLRYSQSHSDEHRTLLNEVFINFTGFFRDGETWIYLATEILPKIMICQRPSETLRVWSAGCASGPEIYSALILMAEVLGLEFCLERVQCYATDIDADALQQAQKATYSDLEILGIPPQLLEKYFQQTQQGYVFHPELRSIVTFQQHDLMKAPPLSAIDLLICRHVLMYFTPDAQKFILSGFHPSLKDTGVLFLSQVESIMGRPQMFSPIHLKHKIFTKVSQPEWNDRFPFDPYSPAAVSSAATSSLY